MVALSRRAFLATGASLAGGLCLALRLPLAGAAGSTAESAFAPNAFVHVASDGTVTLTLHKSEMGQGAHSGLAAILADELDVDLATVRLTMADEDPAYYLAMGMMGTGGSTSIRMSWDTLADAAASARAMLVAAAARTWQVEPAVCRTDVGKVRGPSGQVLRYGELAALAATLPLPEKPPRKPPAAYRYIGKPTPRVDNLPKVTGQARFGIDVTLPGLLTAVVLRPPQFGGTLESFDATAAQALPGVRKIVAIDSGVGVIADGYWQARRAAQKITIKWRPAALAMDDASIARALDAALEQPGSPARRDGDVDAALKAAGKTLEATYRLPFLAHACLEPMNATAHVQGDRCEIWAPTQGQTRSRDAAAALLGIPRDQVAVHTTYLGGGFGRRFEVDFVLDAVALSRAVGRRSRWSGRARTILRTTSTARRPCTGWRRRSMTKRQAPGSTASPARPSSAGWRRTPSRAASTARWWKACASCRTPSPTWPWTVHWWKPACRLATGARWAAPAMPSWSSPSSTSWPMRPVKTRWRFAAACWPGSHGICGCWNWPPSVPVGARRCPRVRPGAWPCT